MKMLEATWEGVRPLIMHNGQLADPLNKYTMAIKEITSKGSKKMTVDDLAERDRLEWEGGLYWDSEVGPHIPTDCIERCIQLGAQKSRKGKDIQAAVFVTEEIVPLVYDGPKKLEKLYATNGNLSPFQIRKGVVIKGNRIMRVRPRFPVPWSISFTLEYDEGVTEAKTIIKAMVDAGALVGLCDWRPKYGRFEVTNAEQVKG